MSVYDCYRIGLEAAYCAGDEGHPLCACVEAGHDGAGTGLGTEGILDAHMMDTSVEAFHLVLPVGETQ